MNKERLSFTYSTEFTRNPSPGFFMVVEGLDGSGNSTQVERLAKDCFYDWEGLNGKFIKVEKEPTYGPFGAPVNYALRRTLEVDDKTLQLGFTTDRSDHLNHGGILDHLKNPGNIVLMDRYFASTVAYGYASGLPIDWLISLQSQFIAPDLMAFVDVDPEICIERIRQRSNGAKFDRYEKLELLTKVREGYNLLMDKVPGLVHKVDGSGSITDVEDRLIVLVEQNDKKVSKSR